MHVKVLFFGLLRDLAGRAEERAEFPDGTTLGDVFGYYATRHPGLAPVLASVLMARNQEFAPADTPVSDGDEIAFLPPVSGGAATLIHEIVEPAGHFFALTRDPVDVRSIGERILQGEDGALVTFEGVVRNNTKGRPTRYLEYECYESMAVKLMARIGLEIASAHSISRIAMVHRLGRIEIGETSVAILASAPHRRPAFEAALEGINRLKKTVPIWKKEYFADGEVWVEGEWDESLRGALIALLLGALAAAQDQPRFRVDVRLIRLLVTAKDNYGKPVGGLKPADFQVFDNGVRQEIRLFEPHTEQPLSLAVLIDISGSTAKDLRYETESVRRFLHAVMRQGNPLDAASIYSFNYDVRQEIDFTRDLRRVEAALRGLKAEGGTSMYDALILSSPYLAQREGRHAVILITDGGDTTSTYRFQSAVEAIQQADAVVYPIVVVPITNDAGRNIGGENALFTLAANTGGRVFTPSDSASLDDAFAEILTDLRTQYLIGYYPKNIPPSRERFHRLEVKVSRPGLHVSSRTGYYEDSDQPSGSPRGRGRPAGH